jgi:hypothetical protein
MAENSEAQDMVDVVVRDVPFMEETPFVPRCWAFNAEGDRCDMPAGHIGEHMVRKLWDDADCVSPIRHQLPEPAPAPRARAVSDREDLVEVEMDVRCESCRHTNEYHLNGEGECAICDCRGFIG